MRHSLEQLKAMSPEQIDHMWKSSQFPFDGALACGHCVTSHDAMFACRLPEHKEFRARASELFEKMNDGSCGMGEMILRDIEEFYALRLFFDHLYPQPEQPAQAETLERNLGSFAAQPDLGVDTIQLPSSERAFARMEENELDWRAGTRDESL